MGITFTWPDEARIRHGNCSSELEEIVAFGGFAEESAPLPKTSRHYALVGEKRVENLPEPAGHAFEYEQSERAASAQEIEARLRRNFQRGTESPEEYEAFIRSETAECLSMSTPSVTRVDTFVRWVSKAEFDYRAREAKAAAARDEAYVLSRWSTRTDEQQLAQCASCPLGLALPGSLIPQRTCVQGSSSTHWNAFMALLERYGNFTLLTPELVDGADTPEIGTEHLARLGQEVRAAREIVQAAHAPAMIFYDKNDEVLGTLAHTGRWYGDLAKGYALQVEGQLPAIRVFHKGLTFMDSPPEILREALRTGDIEELARLNGVLLENQPVLRAREIHREGSTFYALTLGGSLVELPPLEGKTPFDGFAQKEQIARVEYTTLPPLAGFGYLMGVLEGYVAVALRHRIPIRIE